MVGFGSAGPDFSAVDSREKALDLVQAGQLEKLLLFPEAFGGEDIPENTVYVPLGLAESKAAIDRTISAGAAEGRFSSYEAVPKYAGNSFIPVLIEITATGQQSFSAVIRVWGEGLEA